MKYFVWDSIYYQLILLDTGSHDTIYILDVRYYIWPPFLSLSSHCEHQVTNIPRLFVLDS